MIKIGVFKYFYEDDSGHMCSARCWQKIAIRLSRSVGLWAKPEPGAAVTFLFTKQSLSFLGAGNRKSRC